MKSPYPVYPLGLDYVQGALCKSYETHVVDMNALSDNSDLADEIRKFAPDYVGLSIRNIDNTDTVKTQDFLADYQDIMNITRQNSQAPVILGGSGYTIFPVEFIRALQADYGVAGEGERLPALLASLENGYDISEMPGVLTKESASVSYRPWDGDVRRSFAADAGYADYYRSYGGMLNLQTKRGCPFRCGYCTYPHIEGGKMRFFAPKEVARQALALQEAGAKYIFITDSAFNASYEHSLQVAEAFRDARLTIPWGGFFAPTLPPDTYYHELARAGLTHVEFGTESLCAPMLRNLQKPFSPTDVFQAHRQARAADLHIAHYFLLGGPGENKNTLQETLNSIERLEKSVFFFFCGIRLYPHTDLYQTAINEGQISPEQNLLAPVFYRSPLISSEEIIKQVESFARGRANWLIGAGESKTTRILPRLYARGFTGPLWEYLIS